MQTHQSALGMEREILQIAPEPRFEDFRQIDWLAGGWCCAEAAARLFGVAAKVSGDEVGLVGVVAVQRAPRLQRLHQDLAIFFRYGFVKLALLRCLRE